MNASEVATSTRRRSRSGTRARRLRRVGFGLVLAGLAIIGWLLWQFFGTNWASQRHHREVISTLERAWDAGATDAVSTEFGAAEAILRVPRFGKDFEVPVFAGDSDEVLAAGVGHLPDTAEAGAEGNYVLAGHRITHGEPFAHLPDLEIGDEVIVETPKATYTYVVDTGGTSLVVPFTADWVLQSAPVNPDPEGVGPSLTETQLITLVTCSELFHTDNRSVVFGHLETQVIK